MSTTQIVSVKSLTPKQDMALLRKLAKNPGRTSPEYKAQFAVVREGMINTIKKIQGQQ